MRDFKRHSLENQKLSPAEEQREIRRFSSVFPVSSAVRVSLMASSRNRRCRITPD